MHHCIEKEVQHLPEAQYLSKNNNYKLIKVFVNYFPCSQNIVYISNNNILSMLEKNVGNI